MATFLYRLGRLAFRRRRVVVMLWVAVLAAIGIGAMTAPGTSAGALSVPGTQSQQAIDLLQKEFPQASADGATARVVFEAPSGQKLTSAANRAEGDPDAGDAVVLEVRAGPQRPGRARAVPPRSTCPTGVSGRVPPHPQHCPVRRTAGDDRAPVRNRGANGGVTRTSPAEERCC